MIKTKGSMIVKKIIMVVSVATLLLLVSSKSSIIAQDKQIKPEILSVTDKTVFGIALGEKFSVPECEKKQLIKQLPPRYNGNTNKVCFERSSNKIQETGNIVNDSVFVRFPISEAPQIMNSYELIALVLDGNLEGIGFNTAGTRSANMVLEKLKEKYGSPTTFVPKKVQNRLGASFDAFDAMWNLQELVVLFQSVSGSLDSGLVNIDTKKGKEWRERKLKELMKDKRPL